MLRKVGGLASPERWTAGQGAGCHLPSVCVFFGTRLRPGTLGPKEKYCKYLVFHMYMPACRSLRHAVGETVLLSIFQPFQTVALQVVCDMNSMSDSCNFASYSFA